ncbi:MAG TPA: hypothetical protein DCY13_01965, partial [Verrucomicrobiales bacterium]|nr:hypothetical protein [Verrucomicrobiales bacterium]
MQGNKSISLEDLKRRVTEGQKQIDYLSGLLIEYTRAFESRIHISETQLFQELIGRSKLAAEDANLTQAQKFERQIEVVQAAL